MAGDFYPKGDNWEAFFYVSEEVVVQTPSGLTLLSEDKIRQWCQDAFAEIAEKKQAEIERIKTVEMEPEHEKFRATSIRGLQKIPTLELGGIKLDEEIIVCSTKPLADGWRFTTPDHPNAVADIIGVEFIKCINNPEGKTIFRFRQTQPDTDVSKKKFDAAFSQVFTNGTVLEVAKKLTVYMDIMRIDSEKVKSGELDPLYYSPDDNVAPLLQKLSEYFEGGVNKMQEMGKIVNETPVVSSGRL